ncbi:MAG TPA: LPS export ABC transporter periplasmic protein LptC [Nitrospira sp.]|jgi:lipopolysaccharide export system protein LptC|nr:LPS export ABC transporter periplasmic protein LptC [Nitrospira sp.]
MWELVARRALLALSVLLAGFLGYLLLRNADSMPSSRPLASESIEQADAKIEKFIFTQSKGEVVQWQVQAEQAKLFEQDKRAVLRDVALTFYSTEGDEVIVRGEEGTLDTATKDFRLANRHTPLIVETRSGYTIYTNHLVWIDKLREIRTEEPVRMVGHGLEVRGQGLLGRMETEEFEVLRDVHVDLAPSS